MATFTGTAAGVPNTTVNTFQPIDSITPGLHVCLTKLPRSTRRLAATAKHQRH